MNNNSDNPATMLHSAKNLICPSLNAWTCAKTRRHTSGEANGSRPSRISAKPSPKPRACQSVSLSKLYFFAAVAAALPLMPRNTLKNSDDDGSTTITSPFLLKLAL